MDGDLSTVVQSQAPISRELAQIDPSNGLVEQPSLERDQVHSGASDRCVDIFYKNQFHKNYKQDETALRNIIKNHVFQINVKLKLLIYYKNKRVSDFLIRNNLTKVALPNDEKTHVVYRFKCNIGECQAPGNVNTYIGMTTLSLRDRMKAHKYKGSIFAHIMIEHDIRPDVDNLLSSTEILYQENNPVQLHIYEALHIRKLQPSLNEIKKDFDCLKLNIF